MLVEITYVKKHGEMKKVPCRLKKFPSMVNIDVKNKHANILMVVGM